MGLCMAARTISSLVQTSAQLMRMKMKETPRGAGAWKKNSNTTMPIVTMSDPRNRGQIIAARELRAGRL